LIGVAGTSASAPAFAGTVARLNQYLVQNQVQPKPGVGNLNPKLYRMAAGGAAAFFHDVTVGNNIVPCKLGTTDCDEGATCQVLRHENWGQFAIRCVLLAARVLRSRMVMAGEAEAGSAGGQPARNILSETHSDECRGDGGFVFSPVFLSWIGLSGCF
jgi:hypothetical protein